MCALVLLDPSEEEEVAEDEEDAEEEEVEEGDPVTEDLNKRVGFPDGPEPKREDEDLEVGAWSVWSARSV